MKYEYQLNKKDSKKYGFNFLVCNGWFGIYADQFNEKWLTKDKKKNISEKLNISLTELDIDTITKNSISYKEY